MENILSRSISYLKFLDSEFTLNIFQFLKYYNLPEESNLLLVGNLQLLIKTAIYSLILIIPVTFTKILYNSNKIILVIFLGVLITLGISLIGTFLGFFQLAFI